MFRTTLGAVADEDDPTALAYLRPETAQGIFINFQNVQTTMRRKIPFGIAQIGKSFRNEVTPGNFIFRTREFEQMEMEYFVRPGEDEAVHQNGLITASTGFCTLGISRRICVFTNSRKRNWRTTPNARSIFIIGSFPEREEDDVNGTN